MEWLKGKKTYIVAIAVGVGTALQRAGIITDQVAQAIYGVLGGLGLATLRAGVSGSTPTPTP